MFRFLRYFILSISISFLISAQQIDKVIVSGFGGQHDLDVKNAFLIGYSSYNGDQFTGDIILYSYSLQTSFDYAVANDYDLIIRSTTGLPTGLYLAPNYPTVELVMPAGSNSYIQVFAGDVISSPVVITGAGVDSNQTGYQVEFYSIDPITANSYSSFSNGYIAGQLAFIANSLNCSFDSARALARVNGSENGNCDFYNGFGEIQTSNIIAPLPVELTSFIAKVVGENVSLSWQTATEVNNYGFDIERSSSSLGTIWETIGFVEGNGNSNSIKEYSFIDGEVSSGKTYYYRLKQIDNNGVYSFSETIEIKFAVPAEIVLSQNYPNPFNPSTTIDFTLPESGDVSLKIFNPLGEEVATLVNGYMEAGGHSFNFNAENLPAGRQVLPSGMYIYQLNTKESKLTKKMLFIK